MERKLVVSTVGTSLLTNLDPAHRSTLNRLANHQEEELEPVDRALIDNLAHRAQAALGASCDETTASFSAELNGIYNVYKGDWGRVGPADMHVLVGTDTYQGRISAGILRDWWQSAFGAPAVEIIPKGLSAKSSGAFQKGISELAVKLIELITECSGQGYTVIFNLVGGFKSLHGFMTAFGMFYADKTIYIFEGEPRRALIIHNLPINIHHDNIMQCSAQFAILEQDVIPKKYVPDVDPIFMETEGSNCMLSAWGQLVWQQIKNTAFAGSLLEFPLIEYSSDFRKDYEARTDAGARYQLQNAIAKASSILAADRSPLTTMRNNSLKYDRFEGSYMYNGLPLDHFRISDSERIACVWLENKNTLVLLRWYTKNMQNEVLKSFKK